MRLVPLQRLIDSAQDLSEQPRAHLGCSEVGHPCQRWTWLKFRWAIVEGAETFRESEYIKSYGQLKRLFARGHREEDLLVEQLESVGCKVYRRQEFVKLGSHLSGSIDGVVSGPELPGVCLLEIKTHSKKSFADLENHGVEKSKQQHWVQMQLYMEGLSLSGALYVAICKDDDRIYAELIEPAEHAQRLVERYQRLATSDVAPPRVSDREDWYQCRMCPAHGMCHGGKSTREVNCRTCAHSTALPDSTWRCELWGATVPTDAQREGCERHSLHPDMVPWERVASTDHEVATYRIDGELVQNGSPDANVLSSREMLEKYGKL